MGALGQILRYFSKVDERLCLVDQPRVVAA
jgi:hypothetical protein